jgi:hypothetical protein
MTVISPGEIARLAHRLGLSDWDIEQDRVGHDRSRALSGLP